MATDNSFSFAVQVMGMKEDHTTAIYSASDPGLDKLVAASAVKMIDQKGQSYQLLQITPLAQYDELQLGALTFAARLPDTVELHLAVKPPSNGRAPQDIIAAQATGAGSDTAYSEENWWVFRDGYLEQGHYKLSFNAWALYKGDRITEALSRPGKTLEKILLEEKLTAEAAPPYTPAPTMPPRSSYSSPPYPPPSAVVPPFSSPTATIVPPNPVAVELADGKQIDAEATLRIEDIQSGQVSYLYIVLLADGEVKATVIE